MIAQSKIKLIRCLRTKENRYRLGLFIAEGDKTVHQLFHSDYKVEGIYALKSWFERNASGFEKHKNLCHEITQHELERISNHTSPDEVLCLVRIPAQNGLPPEPAGKITLVLDGINDPGNLGSIIRTADWFGIKNIICSTNSVDVYNPKVIQSTMGSCFHVRVYYQNLVEYFTRLKEIPGCPLVIGCTLNGENLPVKYPPSPYIVVLGNESHGISGNLLPFMNQQFRIPGTGHTQSLNVSVATAIISWELNRP